LKYRILTSGKTVKELSTQDKNIPENSDQILIPEKDRRLIASDSDLY